MAGHRKAGCSREERLVIFRIYNKKMKEHLTWDEAKRQANWVKHGLDFADAGEVLASRFRRASGAEREVYDAWLENECNEP